MGLPTGVAGPWTNEASKRLFHTLAEPKREGRKKSKMAIKDGDAADSPGPHRAIENGETDYQEHDADTTGEINEGLDVSSSHAVVDVIHSNISPKRKEPSSDSPRSAKTRKSKSSSGSSSSSKSSSRSPTALPQVNYKEWESDWHDAYASALMLLERSSSAEQRRACSGLLRNILDAKAVWDKA